MKAFYSITLLVFTFSLVKAQDNNAPFQNGTNVISLGLGIGSSIGSFSYGFQTPAISLQYERGIKDVAGPGVISIGGYFGVKTFKYDKTYFGYYYKEKWSYQIFGIRGAYHYNGLDEDDIDLYGGVMLSFYLLNYSYSDDPYSPKHNNYRGDYGSTVGLSGFIGCRYFFTQFFGVYGEIGYGVSYLSGGVVLKF